MRDDADVRAQETWGEREVRRLLGGLRRPEVLANDSLARMVCDVTGSETVVEAMQRVISDAFSGQGAGGERMAQLIMMSDIDAALTQNGVASELGLSRRQYFRYRARAIAVIAQHLHRLLGSATRGATSLPMLARLAADSAPAVALKIYDLIDAKLDPEHALRRMSVALDAGVTVNEAAINELTPELRPLGEAVYAHYLILNGLPVEGERRLNGLEESQTVMLARAARARQRHDARLLLDLGRRLRDGQRRDSIAVARGLLLEAEAAVRLGDVAQADEMLAYLHRLALGTKDVRSVAHLTLLSANRAFIRGDVSEAEELASAALLVLREHHPDNAFCESTVARARLRLGKPWRLPERAKNRPTDSWDRIALEVLQARFDLRDANLPDAFAIASHVLDRAKANGYTGLTAHAAATLAAVAGITGDDDLEQRLYIEAWRVIVDGEDRLAASDLFVFPGVRPREVGPVAVSGELIGAVEDRYSSLRANGAISSEAWYALIEFAAGTATLQPPPLPASELHALDRVGDDLAFLLPPERRDRWNARWHAAVRRAAGVPS